MILQEKIRKKAESFGKLAPVFLEGAKFMFENPQWISVEEDLPYNHKELVNSLYDTEFTEGTETYNVFIMDKSNNICHDCMIYKNGKWVWKHYFNFKILYWFPMPIPNNKK